MDEKAFQDYYPAELSYCYGCGRLNEHGLKLKSHWDGDEAVTTFHPQPYHMVFHGYVYGGLIASLIDCHSTGTAAAAAYRAEGREMDTAPPLRFVTASLKVDYLRPTPIGPLEIRARIKEIKEKIVPKLDDEFAKDIGEYKDLEELKARIREDLKREGEESTRRDLQNQLIERLIDDNPFDVPRSMVEGQIDYFVADTRIRLASQGLAFKDVGVGEGRLRKDFEEAALKRVKGSLILEKISALEGISVKDEEVTERLREISLRTNQNVEKVRGYYQKDDRMDGLKAKIVEEKTLDFLLKRSNITVK